MGYIRREIKFRAWDTVNKKFDDLDGAYLDLKTSKVVFGLGLNLVLVLLQM